MNFKSIIPIDRERTTSSCKVDVTKATTVCLLFPISGNLRNQYPLPRPYRRVVSCLEIGNGFSSKNTPLFHPIFKGRHLFCPCLGLICSNKPKSQTDQRLWDATTVSLHERSLSSCLFSSISACWRPSERLSNVTAMAL